MLVKQLSKLIIAATVILLMGGALWGQEQQEQTEQSEQQQASPWKDRAEYDLFQSITQEQDHAKRVQLLDTYMEKYPETKFELQVRLMYATSYQGLGDTEKLYEAAQNLLKLDPKNLQGHYFITDLTIRSGRTEADYLATGEKSAKALMEIVAGMQKPENLSDAQWNEQKKTLNIMSRRALGWIAMNRKNNEEAETQFTELLKLQPKDGQISYYLGTVILAQRDPAKQTEAFFHFARAANLTGDGAMNAEGRAKVDEYLKKIYTSFHGDESGLDEIVRMALAQPLPPADLPAVKSAAVIAAEKEEQLRRENPQLYMWRNVKEQLTAANGMEYFDNQVRNTAMPRMRGYLVAQSPQERPDTLVLGIEGRGSREVTLKLNEAFRYPAGAGTVINFQCVPRTFSQSPFNLGFECDQAQISGWPDPPARQR